MIMTYQKSDYYKSAKSALLLCMGYVLTRRVEQVLTLIEGSESEFSPGNHP